MPTKPQRYYEDLLDSKMRELIFKDNPGILTNSWLARTALDASSPAVDFLTKWRMAEGIHHKHKTTEYIIDSILSVLRRYSEENAGGFLKRKARHIVLFENIFTGMVFPGSQKVNLYEFHKTEVLALTTRIEELTSTIQAREQELIRTAQPIDTAHQINEKQRLHELYEQRSSYLMDNCGRELIGHLDAGVTSPSWRCNPRGNYANLCRAIVSRFAHIPGWDFSEEFKSALGIEPVREVPRP